MNLRVAVDAMPLLGRPTGVGVMTRELLERLGRRAGVDPVAFAVTWRGRDDLRGVAPPGVEVVDRPAPARPLRWAWRHSPGPPVEWWTGPVDVVHGPNFVVPPARRAARVLTLHDLTAVRYPELCTRDVLAYPDLVARAVDRGAWVHAVSDFVGEEARELFGVPAERLVVVPNGVSTVPEAPEGEGRRLAGRARYVLAVATLEPRKDLPTLVRAFDEVAATDPDLGLVLAGADGWGAEAVHRAVAGAAHGDRIRCTGWVGDGDRAALLREATVLAYPSRYEGFGLPPLEAMSVGVPVVASTAGAVPEVVGDAALLVEPGDADGLAQALTRVVGDAELRAHLVAHGRQRATAFTWDRAADGIVALYERAASTS